MKFLDFENDKLLPVTPELLAEFFCDMDSSEQARFFNHIGEVATKWTSPFCMQLQYITEENGLTFTGRRVMSEIGDYSHWGLITKREENHGKPIAGN